MGAETYVYDRNIDRLRDLEFILNGRCSTCYASTLEVEARLPEMDLVIGAVLVHGAKAPHVITRAQLGADEEERGARRRLDRPGRLLRDLARDDALRPHLRGRRHHALLRRQHARRGADHLDLGAHERHDAVRHQARRQGRRPRARADPGFMAGLNVAAAASPTRPSRATRVSSTPPQEALELSVPPRSARSGGMFWLWWKTLSGS